jgi:hypothetical protein
MQELKLQSHGRRVRREYAPLPGQLEGMAGTSTDDQRKGGQASGIVTRYQKRESTFRRPQAIGWIKTVYPAAIEYTGVTKELKGLAFTFGIMFGLMFSIFGIGTSSYMFKDAPWNDLAWMVVCFCVLVAGLTTGAYSFAFFIRHDLFCPADLPIIFDRKHRKIYRILREEHSGFRGAFKRWAIAACEYDWNLVDSEHQATAYTTGGTTQRNHFLMFLVRKSEADPAIIDSFQIASSMVLNSELVDSMWEHIRLFMEENGPHLPTADEPLADLVPPVSWWQSMGAVEPFGPNYFRNWRDATLLTLALHVLFPVTIPMFLLWGTGNWLSYKTAIALEWPEEVMRAVR